MSEWQPIETAPKDGELILVCQDGICHPEDFPTCIWIAFWANGGYADNVFGWYDWGGGMDSYEHNDHEEFGLLENLTHWMPLPGPPNGT